MGVIGFTTDFFVNPFTIFFLFFAHFFPICYAATLLYHTLLNVNSSLFPYKHKDKYFTQTAPLLKTPTGGSAFAEGCWDSGVIFAAVLPLFSSTAV